MIYVAVVVLAGVLELHLDDLLLLHPIGQIGQPVEGGELAAARPYAFASWAVYLI